MSPADLFKLALWDSLHRQVLTHDLSMQHCMFSLFFGSDFLSAQPYLVPSDGISIDDGHGGEDNFSDAEDNNVFGSVFRARSCCL